MFEDGGQTILRQGLVGACLSELAKVSIPMNSAA